MKDIKLSFPYPSTSRHNLSQDVATSLSMGLLIPVRVIEVLGGDSHRIGTSFSLVSNPLVKPLLQGVNMRYCRFWVPRRIYHYDQRANNSNFDLLNAPVRYGQWQDMYVPIKKGETDVQHLSNFQQSSLFDYLGLANSESNLIVAEDNSGMPGQEYVFQSQGNPVLRFNAEPYVGYIDICRNYFADSATNFVAFSWYPENLSINSRPGVCIAPLNQLDGYIDYIQNSTSVIAPYDLTKTSYSSSSAYDFNSFFLPSSGGFLSHKPYALQSTTSFNPYLRRARFGLCVPMNRPDRLSRLFDTRPLTSQTATIAPSEVSIGNLAFLTKLQRYLTRTFFGGSRFTDVMYSVLGQKVPHVDSPVLLDVFDYELGSELVASTNATESQNPGVLGGFFSAAGRLTTSGGGYKRKYRFNEPGYIMDLVYIMPRLFRTAFLPDYYPISNGATDVRSTPMLQSNFIPDFNGIGWQQPAFVSSYGRIGYNTTPEGTASFTSAAGFCCEPSWQQYRTLPDVCTGAFNPLRSSTDLLRPNGLGVLSNTNTVNSPLFVFTDRPDPYNVSYGFTTPESIIDLQNLNRLLLARLYYSDFNQLNSVFGRNILDQDNIFVVFRYAHQAKRQVTKRFTLNFN